MVYLSAYGNNMIIIGNIKIVDNIIFNYNLEFVNVHLQYTI